ncbi:MAG: hypothetical protein KGQ89_10665, partial [Verrucomicrobia bacterium]|nr:hypothetical protein [Verrucomicrobiota bacterium]
MNIHKISGLCVAAVWIFHGLYSKILDGVPRHRMIVARILGEDIAKPATMFIGAMEVMLGLWVILEKRKRLCAATQTAALVTMNTLEILFARDLLINAPGMVILNAVFIFVIWRWA